VSGHNGKVTLLEARTNTGLSREKVAAQVDISSKTLERWEKGKTPAKRYIVNRLAVIYGVDPDAIELAA
jgi:transcriptional regulator with XRE-family HTH domain